MKKVWPAWLLLFLGAFLLTTAGVAKFWAPHAAERTPFDSYQRTYLTGTADKLDPKTGKVVHNIPVKITNITQIDPNKSDADTVVFVTSTCVNVDTDNPADCLPKSDPRMISDTQSNWAADRRTALAVSDPAVTNAIPVQGLTNKWPFNAEPKSYPVWDDVSKTAPPADYVGNVNVQGVDCRQYHQVITQVPIDLGNGIKGVYSLDETYTIDQRTGKIIDQKLHDLRTLKDGGDIALDLNAEYTPQTISDNVQTAKDGAAQLKLIETTLPLVGLVVGLICLLVGGALLFLRRGSGSSGSAAKPVELSKA
jgi:hypothetical protein